ncbi:MAG: hypothetical protein WBB48_12665 [Thermodesulfobacteriota bacterium]
MRLNFAYPSVSVFPQSSILLQKGEGRDSTPTETALGAFFIVAAQPLKALGAHLRRTTCAGVKVLRNLVGWIEACALYLVVEFADI